MELPPSLHIGQTQLQPHDPLLTLLMASGLAMPEVMQGLTGTMGGTPLASVPAPTPTPTASPDRGNRVGSIGQQLKERKA
jgi:hypothetical protein